VTKEDIRLKTNRPWKTTRVSNYIRDHMQEGSILDFGCGKHCMQVISFRDLGRDVDGYDLWWDKVAPPLEGLYSPKSPPPRKYDIVALSNVINIQDNVRDLTETLLEAKSFVKKKGKMILGYPPDPRYLGWDAKNMKAFVRGVLGGTLETVNGLWVWSA